MSRVVPAYGQMEYEGYLLMQGKPCLPAASAAMIRSSACTIGLRLSGFTVSGDRSTPVSIMWAAVSPYASMAFFAGPSPYFHS
jgi:hypothetical protein